MRVFNVNADEDFLNEILSVKQNIDIIASMFQNSDAIANQQEVIEWIRSIDAAINKIKKIKDDGFDRFQLIEGGDEL